MFKSRPVLKGDSGCLITRGCSARRYGRHIRLTNKSLSPTRNRNAVEVNRTKIVNRNLVSIRNDPCSGITIRQSSKHLITVLAVLWNLLYRIPVLDDFSLRIESKEIHRDILFLAGPDLVRVQRNEVILRHHSDKFDLLARIFFVHLLEVVNERLLSVCH